MATITISRGVREIADNPGRGLPASIVGGFDSPRGNHPKAILTVPGVATIVLPVAPEDVKLSGNSADFGSLDRPGRRPLLYKTGQPLRTLTFTCTLMALSDPTGQVVIEDSIRQIVALCENGSNVFFFANLGYTEFAGGKGWRCSSLDITPTRRRHGSNQITRATLGFTFLENNISQAAQALGPVTSR